MLKSMMTYITRDCLSDSRALPVHLLRQVPLGALLASSWLKLASYWLKLASSWLKLASCWLQDASSWPPGGSSWLQVGSRQLQGHFLRQDGAAGTSKYL